jgi:hypothetical protein
MTNDEDLLSAFFARVEYIVANHPEGEWGDLIRRAFPESLEWDGYVGSMVEMLCGGDVKEVADTCAARAAPAMSTPLKRGAQ